jgi:hypothetical protein
MDSTTETKPSPRISIDLDVEFKKSYAREAAAAKIRNISLTGCFINTSVPLKPSEKINVVLSVSGRTRKITATVVWCGVSGAGIQFQPFNNRDVQIVDDIMYFATEKTSSTRDLLDSILKKVA